MTRYNLESMLKNNSFADRKKAREYMLRLQEKRIDEVHEGLAAGEFIRHNNRRSQYINDFLLEVKNYQRLSSPDELMKDVLESEIIYIGRDGKDIINNLPEHTVHNRIITQLLKKKPAGKGIVVVTDGIHHEAQEDLDDYIKKYRVQKGDRDTFSLIKKNNIKLVAAGVDKRYSAKDKHIAKIVAKTAKENENSYIIVLSGNTHIASEHLVKEVNKLVGKKTTQVFANADELYYKIKRTTPDAHLAKIGKNKYCDLDTNPMIRWNAYNEYKTENKGPQLVKQTNRRWTKNEKMPNYTTQIKKLIKNISEKIGIEDIDVSDLEVYSSADLNMFYDLKTRKMMTDKELADISKAVEQGESYYSKESDVLFLGSLSKEAAAEEAAHLINFKAANKKFFVSEFDELYYTAMTEALGFFGSKLEASDRPVESVRDMYEMYQKNKNDKYAKIDAIVLAHKFNEKNCDLRLKDKVSRSKFLKHAEIIDADMLASEVEFRDECVINKNVAANKELRYEAAHMLGYLLGEELFQAYSKRRGRNRAEFIGFVKNLFLEPMEKEGEAYKFYVNTKRKLQGSEQL